jgi:hypothetical protein
MKTKLDSRPPLNHRVENYTTIPYYSANHSSCVNFAELAAGIAASEEQAVCKYRYKWGGRRQHKPRRHGLYFNILCFTCREQRRFVIGAAASSGHLSRDCRDPWKDFAVIERTRADGHGRLVGRGGGGEEDGDVREGGTPGG